MPARAVKIAAAVALVAVLGGAGGFLVWQQGEAGRQQRTLADRVAAALTNANPDPADFHATPGVAPAEEFRVITSGMGGLKPTVTVTAVTPRADAAYADATLRYVWTPTAAPEPWSYDVTLPLQRTADGWRAGWSASVVAPGLAETERLLLNRLQPERGAILGQGGARLAFTQPAIRVGLDKSRLDAAAVDPAARQLASLLTEAGVAVDAEGYARRAAAAGAKAFVEAALLRVSDPAQAAAAEKVRALPGVLAQPVNRALGLTSSFLRPILGQVGEATPEIIAANPGQVAVGDFVGTGGLQLARDDVLRGRAGYVVQAVLREGRQARDLKRLAATPGKDVETTVDLRLQQAAEAVLAGTGPASALVALRPSDGALVAVASGAGASGVASTATQGLYPPGSTFKIVTALAMLRTGLTPASAVSCPESLTVDGYRFDNFEGYPADKLGDVPLTTAFAQSCNTAFLGQGDRVDQQALASAAEALGLTADPRLVVAASLGRVPTTAEGATEHAASLIGQGKVLASPLGMATVAASVAKGAVVRPRLVVGEPTDETVPAQPLTETEAAALRTLMRAVVTEGGAQSALAGTPGGEILAKTGTATYNPAPGEKGYRTWILGVQGDLAVAVFVADGASGAQTAGPLLKDFLTRASAG